jgi:hypothetical protein
MKDKVGRKKVTSWKQGRIKLEQMKDKIGRKKESS